MTVRHFLKRSFLLAGLLLLPLGLSSCGSIGVDDAECDVYSTPPSEGFVETSPLVRGSRDQLWRPGYWAPAQGGAFVWIPGKFIPRPSPTAIWESARWTRHSYGWTFRQGHWR